MSSKGICDTRCAEFLSVMIKKEENTRIRWFLKNQQKLLDHLEKTKGVKLPPIRESKTQPSINIIHLKPLPNWRSLEPDGSINIDIMKPISPQVKSILYEDAPSFITTENYLHERVKDLPEKRYYYPDCTSWIYGWRLQDCPSAPRSKVGRQAVTMRQFYHPRISSLEKDPEWYRPTRTTAFICDDII